MKIVRFFVKFVKSYLMEEINDLEIELYNGTNEFINKTINITGNGIFLSENSLINIKSLSFHNCKFIGSYTIYAYKLV